MTHFHPFLRNRLVSLKRRQTSCGRMPAPTALISVLSWGAAQRDGPTVEHSSVIETGLHNDVCNQCKIMMVWKRAGYRDWNSCWYCGHIVTTLVYPVPCQMSSLPHINAYFTPVQGTWQRLCSRGCNGLERVSRWCWIALHKLYVWIKISWPGPDAQWRHERSRSQANGFVFCATLQFKSIWPSGCFQKLWVFPPNHQF